MKYENKNFNQSYVGYRKDILSIIPKNAKKVLDVGCSVGALGEQLKISNNKVEVVGVEIDKNMAQIAKNKLDNVIVGNIEELDLDKIFDLNYFDCIILADVLEHLKNPWDVLKTLTNYLNKNGVIIASIPNIRHYTSILSLIFKGHWPYRERGIHDKTHLRFFTLKNINELFEYSNLKITTIKRKYRIIEHPHPLNIFARYLALPIVKDFLTYQYLIIAKKKR
jgi:methionine biosynthesis protein MetW